MFYDNEMIDRIDRIRKDLGLFNKGLNSGFGVPMDIATKSITNHLNELQKLIECENELERWNE